MKWRSYLISRIALCVLIFSGVMQAQTASPQLVPVLQQILQKYKGCILERYETQDDVQRRGLSRNASGLASTNGLQQRDVVQCAAGNMCSLASRQATFNLLQAPDRFPNWARQPCPFGDLCPAKLWSPRTDTNRSL